MTSTKYFLWEFYLDGKCAGFFIHHRSKWKIGILALISFCALLKVVFVTLNITWLLTKILPNHELQLGHSMIEPFIISSSVWCWMVWKVKKKTCELEFGMLSCWGLNCVPPKFICWSSKPNCDVMRDAVFGEWLSLTELVPLKKSP